MFTVFRLYSAHSLCKDQMCHVFSLYFLEFEYISTVSSRGVFLLLHSQQELIVNVNAGMHTVHRTCPLVWEFSYRSLVCHSLKKTLRQRDP